MSDNSLDTTTEDQSVDDQTPNNGDAPDEAQETPAAQETTQAEEESLPIDTEQEAEPGGAAEEHAGEVAEQPATFAASQPEPDEAGGDEVIAASSSSESEAETVEVSTNGEVSVEETEEDEDEEVDDFFAPGDWFVVHTYAGYENKVKANLASRIQSMNMEDKIYDVVVPTEEVMELKSGKMQAIQKKVFPGYILVRMQLDDDSWYVVRNTPGVTGFVGSGAKPTPLDHTEVTKILAPKTEDRPKPKLEYEVSEVVSVVGGAFAGYSGPVESIDQEKQQVRVLLDLFGRETPVELTFDQVTKL
jgi:transcriptional antiterminator NusG